MVAAYLDILINRRIWNCRAIDYSTMQYAMFLVMREIRGKSRRASWSTLLRERLDAETEIFASNDRFRLHGMNGRQIHRLLARMTDYVETRSGQASRYVEYAQRGRKGYEIEHIWANHPERHSDEFAHPSEFQEYRNRIGGLLLLPKSFNASYGDLPYADKRRTTSARTCWREAFTSGAYDHNPGFMRFIKETGLPFQAHAQFKKADLDARQVLYQRLAEAIWNPDPAGGGGRVVTPRAETAAPASSLEVRARLVEALKLDLVGPWAGHALAEERLPGWVRPRTGISPAS